MSEYVKWIRDDDGSWDENMSDDEYRKSHYQHWVEHIEENRKMFVSPEELEGIYNRCVERFNAACQEIERQEDAATIRRLIADVWPTYMIAVQRG